MLSPFEYFTRSLVYGLLYIDADRAAAEHARWVAAYCETIRPTTDIEEIDF